MKVITLEKIKSALGDIDLLNKIIAEGARAPWQTRSRSEVSTDPAFDLIHRISGCKRNTIEIIPFSVHSEPELIDVPTEAADCFDVDSSSFCLVEKDEASVMEFAPVRCISE